ncbi:MAG: alpha/beta hydrolase [Myxococcales bacterium]|nr:alpha/beta hydrolase [Myxococcales bacterium]
MSPPLPAALADWRATGRDLHVHGRRVFVHDLPGPTADAPVLAFLHGFPTSSHDLAPALAALRARCRVVAHDHVGFGLSEKPPGDAYGYSLFEQADVALGVWAALGVSRAHLVAHDYGTSVLTELLARRDRGLLPLDVASITLSNGSVHLDLARLSWPQKLMRSPRVGPLFTRLASERLFHRRMRALFGRPDAVDPATVGAMWALVVHDGGRAALTPLSRYLDERVRYARRWHGALERCDLPAHVLWGRADPIAVPAIAERLAAEIPGATLTWLDDVGHYPTLEAPDRWAAAALAALP